MKFKESVLAHKYLDGLKGIEIGGSAHNPFGLDTINVDYTDDMTTIYKRMEQETLNSTPFTEGVPLKVDVVAQGDELPFEDKSFDFVISSHVIEHFWDPIAALKEWERVARKYIYIIAPHKFRTFDKDREITETAELWARHNGEIEKPESAPKDHYSVWDTGAFLAFMQDLGYNVVEYQDVDDKVGNGFAVVIKLEEPNNA